MAFTRSGRIPKTTLVVLSAAMLFYLVNDVVWLLQDRSSPSYDKAAHARFALQFLRLFEAPTRLSLAKLLKVTQYWPPFFHVSSVPVTMLFGFSVSSVAATNLLFLPVAVLSIYGIGRRLFDDRVAAGAVVLTLLYPIVYALSRTVLVDFALMAMVALAVYLVIATDAGLDPRRSWQLGLAAGCAMLTKWTAVLFIAGPAPVWLVRTYRHRKPSARDAAVGLTAASLVALAVCLPWYVQSFARFSEGARIAFGSDPAQEGDPVKIVDSIHWYWHSTYDALLLPGLMIPTGLGIAAAALWCRARSALLFLLCWILPALVFFVLIPNKDARFVVPALPAVALIAAAGLQSIRWEQVRQAIWLFTVLAGTVQFYAISFGWPAPIPHFYTGPPQRADWRVPDILNAVATLPVPRPIRVAVLPNDPDFEPNLFQLQSAIDRLPLQIDGIGHELESVADLARYDAIISKTGRVSPRYSAGSRQAVRDEIVREAGRPPGEAAIVLWRTWPLPDGSRAEVYVKR